MHISGFPDKVSACQAEWMIKSLNKKAGKKFTGPAGRIKTVAHCLQNLTYWTKNYRGKIQKEAYTITVCDDFYELVKDLEELPNITIKQMTVEEQNIAIAKQDAEDNLK